MQSIREVAKRLRRIAGAVEQQHRRSVGAFENESLGANDDAVVVQRPLPEVRPRSAQVNRSPPRNDYDKKSQERNNDHVSTAK